MEKRRSVLKALGAGAGIGITGVASGRKPDVKVITEFRDVGNGLNKGQIIAAQKRELAPFVKGNQVALGAAGAKDEKEVVGLVAAVNKDGQSRRFIGTTSDEAKVEDVHADVREYATQFSEELRW